MDALLPEDSPARCRVCRYPLRGLTVGRCPECGQPFDPHDPATMYVGRVPGPARARWLEPPGNSLLALAVAAAVGGMLAVAGPGPVEPLVRLSSWMAFFTLLAWVVRFGVFWALARYCGRELLRRRHVWGRCLAAPLTLLCAAALIQCRISLLVAFDLARPAMDRLVREVVDEPSRDPWRRGRWVGPYRAELIESRYGGVRFLVSGARSGGFAYFPDGPPPYGDCVPLSGDWYLWLREAAPDGLEWLCPWRALSRPLDG